MDIHRHRPERSGDAPLLAEDKLLYLGGLLGLTPSLMAGGNGQPLSRAAEALNDAPSRPDFDADAEFIERDLFLS